MVQRFRKADPSPMAKKNIISVALNERLKPAKIYLRQRERSALRSRIFDGQPRQSESHSRSHRTHCGGNGCWF